MSSTPPLWTVASVLQWTSAQFQKRGVDAPRLTAELLLAHALQCSRIALYLEYQRPLEAGELGAFRALIQRRCAGEPTQYLVGAKEFYMRSFAVDSRALIPRPETELLVDFALEKWPKGQNISAAELCTGSGCVALSLALERPDAHIWATELSPLALSLARENHLRLGSPPNVHWCEGDLLDALPGAPRFDFLLANPPYLCAAEMQSLQAEVRFEPPLALDGGPDGMRFISQIVRGAHAFLAPDAWLLLEIGETQAQHTTQLLAQAGYVDVVVHKDLAGRHRIAQGRWVG